MVTLQAHLSMLWHGDENIGDKVQFVHRNQHLTAYFKLLNKKYSLSKDEIQGSRVLTYTLILPSFVDKIRKINQNLLQKIQILGV